MLGVIWVTAYHSCQIWFKQMNQMNKNYANFLFKKWEKGVSCGCRNREGIIMWVNRKKNAENLIKSNKSLYLLYSFCVIHGAYWCSSHGAFWDRGTLFIFFLCRFSFVKSLFLQYANYWQKKDIDTLLISHTIIIINFCFALHLNFFIKMNWDSYVWRHKCDFIFGTRFCVNVVDWKHKSPIGKQ